ncbi:MAG: DJ-1/PfpI family protein, partial [Gemmataceae bacterium]
EVFSFAHAGPGPGAAGLYDVRVVAATTDPVAVRGGRKVIPTNSFKDCPPVDILVVPGGRGKAAAVKDEALLAWVTRQAGKAELVTSVGWPASSRTRTRPRASDPPGEPAASRG